MAFQVGSFCYGDAAQAVSAIASAQVGTVVQHGGAAYVVDAASSDASSITYSFSPLGGGSALTLVAPVTPQPCGLLDWQDGLALGWSIAGVWIAVAAVMVLRKGAHSE
jgi:hypothetical protein